MGLTVWEINVGYNEMEKCHSNSMRDISSVTADTPHAGCWCDMLCVTITLKWPQKKQLELESHKISNGLLRLWQHHTHSEPELSCEQTQRGEAWSHSDNKRIIYIIVHVDLVLLMLLWQVSLSCNIIVFQVICLTNVQKLVIC